MGEMEFTSEVSRTHGSRQLLSRSFFWISILHDFIQCSEYIQFDCLNNIFSIPSFLHLPPPLRHNPFTGIGFLKEWQRLNVAITRAKYAVWIVGHAETLGTDAEWNHLLDFCKEKRLLFHITFDFFLFASLYIIAPASIYVFKNTLTFLSPVKSTPSFAIVENYCWIHSSHQLATIQYQLLMFSHVTHYSLF